MTAAALPPSPLVGEGQGVRGKPNSRPAACQECRRPLQAGAGRRGQLPWHQAPGYLCEDCASLLPLIAAWQPDLAADLARIIAAAQNAPLAWLTITQPPYLITAPAWLITTARRRIAAAYIAGPTLACVIASELEQLDPWPADPAEAIRLVNTWSDTVVNRISSTIFIP